MESYNIYGVLIALSFIVVVSLDIWSTLVGFRYNKKFVNDESFREKIVLKFKNNEFKSEANYLPKIFMQTFGVKRGMIVFSLIWNVPIFGMLSYCVFSGILNYLYALPLVAFYCGAMYRQVFCSFGISKDIKNI